MRIFQPTISGSLTVITGSSIELRVTNTGVNMGSAITDLHTVTGSFIVTGSAVVTGSMTVTSLTSNRAVATDANDQLVSSATTDTELGYLNGVTSGIQTQLNSKTYTLSFFSNAWTIAAGQTYYIGNFPRNPATAAGASRVYIPKAGTITDAIFQIYSAGVIGSNNGITASIRLNNTTDYLIEQNAVAVANRTFTNNSLSIPVVVGDYIEMKMQIATPYTTVPTNNFPTANILIKT